MALQRIERDGIQDDAINAAKIEDGTVAGQDIADGTITNTQIHASAAIATAKISGLGTAATLAHGTSANQVVRLDSNAKIPAVNASLLTGLNAANITPGGTLPAISGANLTGVATDTSAMENNIAILAFKVQSANNLTKFNLVDQVIDEYKDDTGLDTQTNCDRVGSTAADGYMSTIVSSTITNTFTIEMWVRIASTAGTYYYFDHRNNGSPGTKGLALYNHSNENFYGWEDGSTLFYSSNSGGSKIAANTWGILTYSQTASTGYWHYAEGYSDALTLMGSDSRLPQHPDTYNKFIIGAYNNNGSPSGYWLNGQIDDLRISGVARYGGTGTFTNPGASAFTADSDTLGLWSFNNSLADQSGNSYGDFTGVNTSFSTTAKAGSHSLSFNGSNAYAYLPEDAFSLRPTRSSTTTNATGTIISTANTALSAPTTGDICMLIENAAGTATLNTDLKAYVSRNGGTGWDQVTLADKGSWGTNKKILTANNVAFSNSASGTDMRYKIEWANQASGSKETRVHATSLAWA